MVFIKYCCIWLSDQLKTKLKIQEGRNHTKTMSLSSKKHNITVENIKELHASCLFLSWYLT